MFSKKQILKILLGVTPALIGLLISLNGLKIIEERNEANNNIIAEQSVVDNDNEPVKEDKEETIDMDIVIISDTGLNVRKEPSLDSTILKTYPFAKVVNITQEVDGWYKTKDGYIYKEYTEEVQKALDESLVTHDDIERCKRIYEDYELDLNKSVTGKSGLNMNEIRLYTNKYPGLRGVEQAAIDAEYEYGINAFTVLAVASLESGFGKSDLAKDKNNLYGMNAHDSNPYELAFTYGSKYESVMDFAKRLKNYYIDEGLTTTGSIQGKYCPTNNEWDESVDSLMNKIYNIALSARE